jgi:hypothetical protein
VTGQGAQQLKIIPVTSSSLREGRPDLTHALATRRFKGFCKVSRSQVPRRREVFAKNSSKWGDPRAKLLDGEAWEQAKPTVLASLALPAEAGEHLAARAALLDGTYREVVGRVSANSQIVYRRGCPGGDWLHSRVVPSVVHGFGRHPDPRSGDVHEFWFWLTFRGASTLSDG